MTINLIPYGLLENGNYGINLDNTSQEPLAAALEVKDTLPPVASADNFPGRLVFSKADATIFLYIDTPSVSWVALEGLPATVGPSTGVSPFDPPIVGSEVAGELYWTTDTEVLFVWDGLQWQAAGGSFATQVIERRQVGDNINVVFPAGITTTLPSEYVEVFIDGVRQNSLDVEPVTGDYVIVGTNVVFTLAPVLNAEVFIRSMQTVQVVQNTEVTETITTAGVGQTVFLTGVAGTDPASIIVSVDGFVKVRGATEDYTVNQADTTIASIVKAFPADTTANVATNADHGITTIGTVITIGNVDSAPEYNDSFVVSGIPNLSELDITVPATSSDSVLPNIPGAGDNVNMFFDPPFFSDEVVFNTPFFGGEKVYIKNFKNLIVAPSQGEANTLSLIGTSLGANITSPKVGVDLQVKGILGGANIVIIETADNIEITASTGANFENRAGFNGALYAPGEFISYVGALDTPIPGPSIVVDLSSCGPGGGAPTPGRKITIKDEGGLAGTVRNIEITGPFAATFGSIPAPYVIAADKGSVTLVLDSSNNWNITVDYNGTRTFSGTGSPNGVVTAPTGSTYINTAGGVGTTFYVKETGTGSTGWDAK